MRQVSIVMWTIHGTIEAAGDGVAVIMSGTANDDGDSEGQQGEEAEREGSSPTDACS